MRCVIQRVAQASVSVAGEQIGAIQQGFMVLIGVSTDDTDHDVHYMAEKVPNLRIFEDEAGKMNRSLKDVGGAILAVSQFTLYGDARGGLGQGGGVVHAAAPALSRRRARKKPMNAMNSLLRRGARRAFTSKPDVSARICRCRSSTTGL